EPVPPASMRVRSVDAKADAAQANEPPAPPIAAAPRPRPAQPRRPREVSAPAAEPVAMRPAESPEPAASEPVFEPVEPMAAAASAAGAAGDAASASTGGQSPAAPAPLQVAAEPAAASQSASAPSPAALSSFLAAGEEPPPTYATKLPPPVTLRYEVRRGFFRGTGEIRWQRSGDTYELRLEARIAGLTLLAQTSEGRIDANGLAPLRFVDQRARRAAQAANFRRDSGTITFSGPSTVWPLLPGTQDQLSWMIQLAGIVAAEPDRASVGGRVSMVVVDARGQASVRTLRCVGRESVETAAGRVSAVKFVSDARSAYDSSDEIWLDPEHDFVPAHATRRNSSGESEYDLLLEAIEPAR
ncbi:MAG TPA: DUF3108 domain-containing protein, partial [Caldimonas sp.]|nr:DUF3108 domain-containing protein [Caldimonas sp.]